MILGAPSSFSCPVIRQCYSARRSHTTESGNPDGLATSLSCYGSWPWDGRPIFGVGVVRSFPWRKSQRTRRMAPRAMLGAARFSVVEKKCSSHIPRTKIAQMEMLITSFFSNIFSWTQSRTERSSGQRFYPRPPHGRFPGSSCPQSDGHPPGGPESPARS